MLSRGFRRSAWITALLAGFFVGLPSLLSPGRADAVTAPLGVPNAGFEDGTLDGSPSSWTVTAVDRAKVVDCEGPTEFTVYAASSKTVCPRFGNLMLGLGKPAMTDQSQAAGANTASVRFIADRSTISFFFRLLGVDHRSGNDLFSFDLKDALTATSVGTIQPPLVVSFPEGKQTCSALPCTLMPDAGQQGNLLDTDWIKVEIGGLGAYVGTTRQLILSFTLTPGPNSGQPSWAYVDADTPPIARFEFLPNVAPAPLEGDKVTFRNRSYDKEGAPLTSVWKICKKPAGQCALTPATFDAPPAPADVVTINGMTHPLFIFSDEGSYDACVRVSDGDLASTICDGAAATDGFQVPPLLISNAAPKVNAVNVEVIPGRVATLSGGFIDAGWRDTHTASFSVPGYGVSGLVLQEENVPAFSSGRVTGALNVPTAAAPATLSGTLTVSDGDQGSSSDGFVVRIISADPQMREPNGTTEAAPTLESDGAYVGYIGSKGDIDVYRVTLPGGAVLPARGELLVTLRGLSGDLPADYDLVILAKMPSGVQASTFLDSPFLGSSFLDSTFLDSTFLDSTFLDSSFLDSTFLDSTFLDSTFLDSTFLDSTFLDSTFLDSELRDSTFLDSEFRHFALSDLGFAVPQSNEGGADFGPDELGLAQLTGASLRIAGYSANRGTAPEATRTVSAFEGTEFYVAVVGANGVFSASEPYVVQIETSVPLDLDLIHGQKACTGTPLATWGGPAPASPTVLHANSPSKTLFVTVEQRLRALYDMDSIDWSAFLADFVSLSNRSDVKGRIVSMDTASVRAAFDAADADPCDVQATNDVAAAIRTEIAAQLAANPTIQYVVILGNDRVIPFYREKDQTIIANEKLYLNGSLLKPSSPLYAALAGGFFLQQDYYVSSSPLSFEAGLVYVADHAIARLGETDMQMRAQAQAFVASDGRLNPKTAATDLLVTGYDFFADGARDVADALAGQLIATELIKPPTTWTADDVRCRFLGIGAASCSVPGLSFFNGHMSHFAHQSAAGDSVRTNEVPAAGANFIGMAISMGCHSGYSVPDGAAFTPSGLGINPNRDWVQALQMAMYIAPTGFGYGDSDIVLGNELLIVLIAERLAQDGVVAGEALKEAKLAYLQRSALTDYDLKSISQQTFYGLPMYRVVYDTQTAVQSRPSVQQIGTPAGTLNLTISERGGANPTVNKSLAIARHDTSRGSYYSLDGQFQVTAGRPTHGVFNFDIPDAQSPNQPPGDVHGVFMKSGSFDRISSFDPVIGTPSGLGGSPEESQICIDSNWPAFPVTGSNTGGDQTLTVLGSQFRCTGLSGGKVAGDLRLFTGAEFELLRSISPDKTRPDITGIDFKVVDPATDSVEVTVHTSTGDVVEVVLLVINEAIGQITSQTATFSGAGPYKMTVANFGQYKSILVQARDAANNVSYWTMRGSSAKVIRVEGVDPLYTPGTAATFNVKVYGVASLAAPIFYTMDFGDGTATSGAVTGALAADGSLTFAVQHTYAATAPSQMTALVKVTDADGAVGVDDILVLRRCDPSEDGGTPSDPNADLVGCATLNDATTLTFVMRVEGQITSGFQYRIDLDNGKVIIYRGGTVTGFNSAEAAVSTDGKVLRVSVKLSELRVKPGNRLRWAGTTQAGVPANQEGTGIIDRMPDTGFVEYVVQ